MNEKTELILRKSIDNIIDYFDFSKVEKVMKFLDWEIYVSKEEFVIPNIQQLIKEAKNRIFEAAEKAVEAGETIYSCSGPFKAMVDFDKSKDEFNISLMFVVEEAFNY